MSDVAFHELFPLGADDTPYRKLTGDFVSPASFEGERVVKIAPDALTLLARQAFVDCQHLLRPGHLAQLRTILDDPGASANDKFVALDLLKNANIAAGKVLPMCQDTGTAIVMAKKGQQVWTGADDAAAISEGIRRTYTETNLRYSQVAPLSMYEEVNTGDNLPAQIDIYAEPGEEYDFLFIAKGGGSANKSFLYQQSKAVLNPKSLLKFIDEKIRTLGTAACPPYHLAIVVGGTSAEMNLKTVKLASTHYLDNLPTSGNKYGQAFRDIGFEQEVLELSRKSGIGAQFGGKYFCHVARDIAHAKLKERLDRGEGLPQYVKDHPIYYAGPAKTPAGYASGSFGPTTAGRMDSYVDQFMAAGGSFITLAKGNRSTEVREACRKHGGFYLGSIGGPAARLAQDCIRHVEVLEYPELGMEAIWQIEVEDFPAFIVVDDKGNDFFDLVSTPVSLS